MEIGRDCIRPHDLASPRFKANPYPFYARLRAKARGSALVFCCCGSSPQLFFSTPSGATP